MSNCMQFKRFVRQEVAGPSAVIITQSMADQNLLDLKASKWIPTEATAAAMPPLNYETNPLRPEYDTFKYASDYSAGKQKAYLGIVAYRFEIPQDAWDASEASILSVSLPLYVERWLIGGVRLAAVLSDNDLPSDDWTTIREGDFYQAAQLPEVSPRVDQNSVVVVKDDQSVTIGVGDDATTNYSGNLPITECPIVASTVEILAGTQTVTDDGSGNLVGDVDGAGTNTIDYSTGAYDVTFSSVVPSTESVDVSWAKVQSLSKYLFVYVSLEDLTSVCPLDNRKLEGGALIVGDGVLITYDRDVAFDDIQGTELPVLATNKISLGGETYDTEPTECTTAGVEIATTDADDDWKRFAGSLGNWLKGPDEHVSEPAATYPFEIDYVGVGFTEDIRINVFENKWYNGVPTAVLRVSAPASYPAKCHARCVEGIVPGGDVWMFAFVDKDGDGVFKMGGICGVPNNAPEKWKLRSGWQACPINLFGEIFAEGTIGLQNEKPSFSSSGEDPGTTWDQISWQPYGYLTVHYPESFSKGHSLSLSAQGRTFLTRYLPLLDSNYPSLDKSPGIDAPRKYIHIGDILAGNSEPSAPDLLDFGFAFSNWTVQLQDGRSDRGQNINDNLVMACIVSILNLPPVMYQPLMRPLRAYEYLHPVIEFSTTYSHITAFDISIVASGLSGSPVTSRKRVLSPRHDQSYYRYRVLDSLSDGNYFVRVRTIAPTVMPVDYTNYEETYSEWSYWNRFVVDSAKSRPPERSAGFFAEAGGSSEKSHLIATGNGGTASYSGTLPASRMPMDANSVQIGDGTHEVTDDGSGNLIGDVGSGTNTINYTTGDYDVTFSSVTPTGDDVYIFWRCNFSTASSSVKACGWSDATVFGHVHETTRLVRTLKFESAIPSYPDWMTIRLVGYLIPLSNSAADQNMVLANAEYTNADLWYGTETSLDVVVDGVESTVNATPILVKDLSPDGYSAETEFPIVRTDLSGPFAIMFVAGPLGVNSGAESVDAVAGTFYGLEDWQPKVVSLEK